MQAGDGKMEGLFPVLIKAFYFCFGEHLTGQNIFFNIFFIGQNLERLLLGTERI